MVIESLAVRSGEEIALLCQPGRERDGSAPREANAASSFHSVSLSQLKYTRPGLPTFSQDVLCKWKTEIKMYRRVHCPNQVTLQCS